MFDLRLSFLTIILASVANVAVANEGIVAASSNRFVVKKIEVEGNTVLDNEIKNLTTPYIGKAVDYAGLHRLKTKISNLYVKEGFVNSGAYLPPQKVKDGVVNIQVLEGEIGEINVTGNNRLSSAYIENRLAGLKTPLTSEALMDRLYVLRQDPLIENVSAELAAGTTPGQSILEVDIEEAKAFSTNFSLNNHKSPAVGSFARSAGLTHNNLFGWGDRASLDYTNTEGSDSLDLSYGVPLNRKNGRFTASYGFSSNDVVEDVFSPLDIETEANYWQFNYDQPVILSANRQLALGLTFSRQHSETSLLNLPFALSRGSDSEGNTNVSALRFYQEYRQRGEDQVLALRSQFSLGIDAFDANISNDEEIPDGQFFSWRGQSQFVRNLAEDLPLILRGDLQLAASPLVPFEQFRLGGASTVRGYRKDVSLGDNAFLASVETRIPLFRVDKVDGLFQLAPFFDFGTAWNSGNFEVTNSSLASVGLGFNFTAGDRLNARLDWGIPLNDIEGVDDQPVSFSLNYGF